MNKKKKSNISKRIYAQSTTMFTQVKEEARRKGYGTTKPSVHQIWQQWHYYVPPMALQQQYDMANPNSLNEVGYVMYPILERMSNDSSWIIVDPDNKKMASEDFAQLMLTGFMPYKDVEAKGLISGCSIINSIAKYDPESRNKDIMDNLQEIDGIRQYVCPRCGESLWTEEAKGPGPKTITISYHPETNHRNQRSCGGAKTEIDPGDYPRTIDGVEYLSLQQDPYVLKEGKKWHRYCGHPIDLPSLSAYLTQCMKTVRTEEYRYRTSVSKHRTAVTRHLVIMCDKCHSDIYDMYDVARKENRIQCPLCGHMVELDSPDVYTTYTNINPNIEIDRTFATDGEKQQSVKDSLHERLTDTGKSLSEHIMTLRDEFNEALYRYYVGDADDKDQIREKEVAMFIEYFFKEGLGGVLAGEQEESPEDKQTYARLAKKFFNLTGHYTQCLDCGHKMSEPNEEKVFRQTRLQNIQYCNDLYDAGISITDSTVGSRVQCEHAVIGSKRHKVHSIDISKYDLSVNITPTVQDTSELETVEDWSTGLFGDVETPEKQPEKVLTVTTPASQEEVELTGAQLQLLKAQDIEAYRKYLGLNVFYHGEDCTCGAHGKIRINIHQDPQRRVEKIKAFLREQYQQKKEPFYTILTELIVASTEHSDTYTLMT